MPVYFYRGAYTAEAWRSLIAEPRDVSELMRPGIERFGGGVIACFLTVAGAEPAGFVEFPDDTSATAWGMHLQSSGFLREVAIAPMMTTEDGLTAMRRVGAVSPHDASPW